MHEVLVTIDRDQVIAPVDRRLFGSFVEHLGRCVYGGIYEPGHPTADDQGFRGDVIDLVRELGVSTIRYPGGNFVSGYRWEDGVGPRAERPRRLDLAWRSLETNEVGTDELARWTQSTGTELMMAVNLGTRGLHEALDLLEYVNHPAGSTLADRRRANGAADPHGVRIWCLGNEMDGPWQLGHMDADAYGELAARTAAAMRMFDPGLKLVVCGSSSAAMPTFGQWERTVLEHCYPNVDYISCHAYYQELDGDTDSFLATSLELERFIDAVASTVDQVKRDRRESRAIALSLDEWNIWDIERFGPREPQDLDWSQAPRLLEQTYTVADAVVLGSLLIAILGRCDRVRLACLAQLVNVIAPIMTEPGGAAWRQTTFFPFATTSRMAHGQVLRPAINGPDYETARYGRVAAVDAVATHDPDGRRAAIFLVNRDRRRSHDAIIDIRGLSARRVLEAQMLADADLSAKNTSTDQRRVALLPNPSVALDQGQLTMSLPPASWHALALAL